MTRNAQQERYFSTFRLHRTALDMSTNRLPIGSFFETSENHFCARNFCFGVLYVFFERLFVPDNAEFLFASE
jgi:hypothetical protein